MITTTYADQLAELEAAGDTDALRALWKQTDDPELRHRITQAGQRVGQPRITQRQSRRLHAILTNGGINRVTKLALLSALTGREITTSAQLTTGEAAQINTWLADTERLDTPLLDSVLDLLIKAETDGAR